MNQKLLMQSAILAVSGSMMLGTASASTSLDSVQLLASQGKEKCYGVAQKGQNDCGANGHACAGYAKEDYDPKEWKYVAKGTCEQLQDKVAKLKNK